MTVNCPLLLGSAASASLATIETTAVSSSLTVNVVTLAFESTVTSGSFVPSNVSVTVSSSSSTRSSITLTSIVAVVSPAAMVTEVPIESMSLPTPAEPDTAKLTTVSLSLVVLMVMVNWPASDGSAAEASETETETVAVSLSAIVTVDALAPGVPSTVMSGSSVERSVTTTVSLSSKMASSRTLTSIVAAVSPAAIVTVRARVVKSIPSSPVVVTE